MSSSDGTLVGVFGSPGCGKSTFIMETLLPQALERGDVVVYSTPKTSDAERWKLGPVVRSPRELYGKPVRARAILVLGNHPGALELVRQLRTVVPRVTQAYDEAHEVWPSSLDASPEKLQRFHTVRDERGSTLVWASQWPAKFSKTIYRATTDLGGVYWHRLTTPRDVEWVEEEYGAAAALQVSELAPFTRIHVRGAELPKGWDEFRERLRRKAARYAP